MDGEGPSGRRHKPNKLALEEREERIGKWNKNKINEQKKKSLRKRMLKS